MLRIPYVIWLVSILVIINTVVVLCRRREVQDMLDRLFRDSQVYRSDHMPHPHGDRMGDMSGCSETYQSGKRAARARRRRKKKT